MTTMQTGTTADVCITNPGSDECTYNAIWTGVGWTNIGTSAMLTRAIQTGRGIQAATIVNTGVNLANIGVDAWDITQSCGDGQFASDFGCVAAWGGLVFDVGQGGVDIARAISNLPGSNFAGSVMQLDGPSLGALPDNIPGGAIDKVDLDGKRFVNFDENNIGQYLPSSTVPSMSDLAKNTSTQQITIPSDGIGALGFGPGTVLPAPNPTSVHLAKLLDNAGVNLSFPDVTINNLTNTIARSPLTGDVSITTLDTVILPNGSPTNLNNVMAQAANTPPTALTPDTPNNSRGGIGNWLENMIGGNNTPSTNIDAPNIIDGVIIDNAPNIGISNLEISINDGNVPNVPNLESVKRSIGNESFSINPSKPTLEKYTIANGGPPPTVIDLSNARPRDFSPPQRAIIDYSLGKISRQELDVTIFNFFGDNVTYKFVSLEELKKYSPTADLGTTGINYKNGTAKIFLLDPSEVSKIHGLTYDEAVLIQLQTLGHEFGEAYDSIIRDTPLDAWASEYRARNFDQRFIEELGLNQNPMFSQQYREVDSFLKEMESKSKVIIEPTNWFQQKIYSPTDGFLPVVRNWFDDTFGRLLGSVSPANNSELPSSQAINLYNDQLATKYNESDYLQKVRAGQQNLQIENHIVDKIIKEEPVLIFHRLASESDIDGVSKNGIQGNYQILTPDGKNPRVAYFTLVPPNTVTEADIFVNLNVQKKYKIYDARNVDITNSQEFYSDLYSSGYDGVITKGGVNAANANHNFVLFDGTEAAGKVKQVKAVADDNVISTPTNLSTELSFNSKLKDWFDGLTNPTLKQKYELSVRDTLNFYSGDTYIAGSNLENTRVRFLEYGLDPTIMDEIDNKILSKGPIGIVLDQLGFEIRTILFDARNQANPYINNFDDMTPTAPRVLDVGDEGLPKTIEINIPSKNVDDFITSPNVSRLTQFTNRYSPVFFIIGATYGGYQYWENYVSDETKQALSDFWQNITSPIFDLLNDQKVDENAGAPDQIERSSYKSTNEVIIKNNPAIVYPSKKSVPSECSNLELLNTSVVGANTGIRYDESFVPDVVAVNDKIEGARFSLWTDTWMVKEAVDPVQQWVSWINEQGYSPFISSAYRSYETQDAYSSSYGNEAATAGGSCHQSGLCFDVHYFIDNKTGVLHELCYDPNRPECKINTDAQIKAQELGIAHPYEWDQPHYFVAVAASPAILPFVQQQSVRQTYIDQLNDELLKLQSKCNKYVSAP
ncbi:MAG: hypothetical protein QY322_04065 [bacterium]|nr:MAG: hypothetical protein QY322_04065 [bacterium]